jgi:hypothetical protein
MPALILSSMSGSVNIATQDIIMVLLIAVVLYGFLIGMALLLPKILKVDKNYTGLYRYMAIFGNVGFVGYPVIVAVLGKEALFYAAIFNIPFNLLAYSVGIYFITMDTKKKGEFNAKKFLNPGIVATLIGLILFVFGINIPGTILNITSSVGNITTPLSLIVVGGSLYGVKINMIFKKHIIFVYSFVKLFLVPTIFAFVISLIGVRSDIASIAIIIVAMPMGANTVILSQEYDGHVLEASEAVFVSTLLIVISLPYIIFLINTLF